MSIWKTNAVLIGGLGLAWIWTACGLGGNSEGSVSTGGTTGVGGAKPTGGASNQTDSSQPGNDVEPGEARGAGGATSTDGFQPDATAGGSAAGSGGVFGRGGYTGSGGKKAGGGGSTNAAGIANAGGSTNAAGIANAGGSTNAAGIANAGGSTNAGAPYKGIANSPCAERKALKVSWYYNWMQKADAPCTSPSEGGEFVPMIWGHTGGEQEAATIASSVASFVRSDSRYVLGFNEPDNASQSNISVAKAISLWSSFDDSGMTIGSPATQANTTGVAWMKSFMSQIEADSELRVDFIAIHWYGWNEGSCEANASTLENYIKQVEAIPGNRPVWLTEWGCLHQSAPDDATVQAHVAGAIKMFAKHPRLVRYAWYPWADRHALNNEDGSLTALGETYAAAPAYR